MCVSLIKLVCRNSASPRRLSNLVRSPKDAHRIELYLHILRSDDHHMQCFAEQELASGIDRYLLRLRLSLRVRLRLDPLPSSLPIRGK